MTTNLNICSYDILDKNEKNNIIVTYSALFNISSWIFIILND